MEQALKYQAVEATAEKELWTDTLRSKETPAAIATTRNREMTSGEATLISLSAGKPLDKVVRSRSRRRGICGWKAGRGQLIEE